MGKAPAVPKQSSKGGRRRGCGPTTVAHDSQIPLWDTRYPDRSGEALDLSSGKTPLRFLSIEFSHLPQIGNSP